jgi:hypothetical protein
MMQAFAYRHLVPAQELVVSVVKTWVTAPAGRITSPQPARLAPGSLARVKITTGGRPVLDGVQFKLSEPPKGVTLDSATAAPDGLELAFKVEEDAPLGVADNLFVEVFSNIKGRVTSLGLVPAIAFEIAAQ